MKRIVFPPDAGGSRISFAFEDERFDGRKFYSSDMSDRMVAFLCLLAAVLHPNQTGVLGLDEPDANLHPSALRRFVSLAERPHERRALVIVTHSDALLEDLEDPAGSIRIVEATKDGTKISKLDRGALEAWRESYTMADMRRTGLLDGDNTSYEDDR